MYLRLSFITLSVLVVTCHGCFPSGDKESTTEAPLPEEPSPEPSPPAEAPPVTSNRPRFDDSNPINDGANGMKKLRYTDAGFVTILEGQGLSFEGWSGYACTLRFGGKECSLSTSGQPTGPLCDLINVPRSCYFQLKDRVSRTKEGLWTLTMSSTIKEFDLAVLSPDDQLLHLEESNKCFEKDFSFQGHDLYKWGKVVNPQRLSPESCNLACIRDEDCYFWTYIGQPKQKECWLKNETAVAGRRKNQFRISGPKFCLDCFKKGRGISGQRVAGQEYYFMNSHYECQQKCQAISECDYFSYNSKNRRCYLKKAITRNLTNPDATSGPKFCKWGELFEWSSWTEWRACPNCKGRSTRKRICLDNSPQQRCSGTDKQGDCPHTCPSTPNSNPGEDNEEYDDDDDKEDRVIPPNPPDTQSSGTLPMLGTIMLIVAIVVVLAGALLIVRKRRRRRSLQEAGHMVPTVVFKKKKDSGKTLTLDELMAGVRNNSIPPRGEFQELESEDRKKHVLVFPMTLGMQYNTTEVSMNRYSNIVPYDHNRVILVEPIHGCNYINASWVRGEDGRNEGIAAQGPLKENVPHFLQAILENDVTAIVMLTSLKEKNKAGEKITKCEQYWPEEGKQKKFGSVKVKTLHERKDEYIEGLVRRVFQISSRSKSLETTQYHYTKWPDFGVPYSPKPLVALAKELCDSMQNGTILPLVHCSAGVGRTGTFMGLVRAMLAIENGASTISVYDIVLNLRKERTCMVQKAVQYVFLYQCIDCFLRERRESALGKQKSHHVPNEYIYYNIEHDEE